AVVFPSGSTPRSAPLRSLRCRLPYGSFLLGRLHAPLPSGRFAVVSLTVLSFWVDSTLRSPPVASLSSPLLRRLPGLALHALSGIADALALVRLGLANLANVGRNLTDELLVETAHDDTRGLRNLERDARGRLDSNRVG